MSLGVLLKIQAPALSLLTRAFLCLDLPVASRHTPIMAGSSPRTNPAVSTPMASEDADVAGALNLMSGEGGAVTSGLGPAFKPLRSNHGV